VAEVKVKGDLEERHGASRYFQKYCVHISETFKILVCIFATLQN